MFPIKKPYQVFRYQFPHMSMFQLGLNTWERWTKANWGFFHLDTVEAVCLICLLLLTTTERQATSLPPQWDLSAATALQKFTVYSAQSSHFLKQNQTSGDKAQADGDRPASVCSFAAVGNTKRVSHARVANRRVQVSVPGIIIIIMLTSHSSTLMPESDAAMRSRWWGKQQQCLKIM